MHNSSVVRKVCFISSRSGYLNSQKEVITDWANGRLISELLKNPDCIFSLAIFADPKLNSNYNHSIKSAQVYPLPFPMSYYHGLKNSWKVWKILKKIQQENDVLIVQLPIISFLPLIFLKKPVVYHICANVLTASNNPFKYKGLSLLSARMFAGFMHTIHRYLFRKNRNRLVANGNELGDLYKKFNPRVTVSSSIYLNEIVESTGVQQRASNAFNMLFIGRPSKEKGIDVLIKAFDQLQSKNPTIRLHMIGVEKHELTNGLAAGPIHQDLLQKIAFHGFVPWGDTFKAIVRSCHVLIMSSISEGTPRVLIEARALGCPVIANNIGGIGTSITDGVDGVLIRPGDEGEIIGAVNRLMNDEKFRLQLAQSGLKTTSKFTLESFSQNFFASLNEIS